MDRDQAYVLDVGAGDELTGGGLHGPGRSVVPYGDPSSHLYDLEQTRRLEMGLGTCVGGQPSLVWQYGCVDSSCLCGGCALALCSTSWRNSSFVARVAQ